MAQAQGKGKTRKAQTRADLERNERAASDPLAPIRQAWILDEDRFMRMLGYVSEAYSPASARLRADPYNPITNSDFTVWVAVPENAELYQTAQDFGEAKLTDELRAQSLNLASGRKGSHVATQVMMRVIGRTPAQIQRTANDKPKELPAYVPPEELVGMSDEELEVLVESR